MDPIANLYPEDSVHAAVYRLAKTIRSKLAHDERAPIGPIRDIEDALDIIADHADEALKLERKI